MIQTGPTNSIFDASTSAIGLSIGHAHDRDVKTGVTVILPSAPATASVDVRGGGPGTREVMALADGGLIEQVHAIVLSGGSVYGLGAADGVAAYLGARGIGYKAGPPHVPVSPIVPSAILFDNANDGDKSWGETPPFRALGITACKAAKTQDNREGNVGAGFGAAAGLYPGGLGMASEVVEGVTVAAIIAANPVGSPYLPGTQVPHMWAYEAHAEFMQARPPADYRFTAPRDTKLEFLRAAQNPLGQSTVIGCIAITAPLTQKQLRRLAIMAQDGIAMAVQPSHTPLDGDTIFALSTGACTREANPVGPAQLALMGAAAARCVGRALTRGVLAASKSVK